MDVYQAYWFIYNHPNCIVVDPNHPLVDFSLYAHEGFGEDHLFAHGGKPIDAEYERGRKEWSDFEVWRGQFIHNLDIHFAKVNPRNHTVDVNASLNTLVEVWLETGPAYWNEYTNKYESNMHDPSLDCAGATFEEALIKLAALIIEHYGDYPSEEATS